MSSASWTLGGPSASAGSWGPFAGATGDEMEAEDLSGKELPTITSIMNKVRDIKNKIKNEDLTDELNFNKVSADTSDNSGTVNRIMMTANNPENWLSFLLKIEKKSVPQDDGFLNKLIGRYSQAIEALPPDKYGQNESYARIQVRFAELKAIQEPDDARDCFQMAKANCKRFAFVHVSFAQFELSQGNFKKSKQLLQKALECGAVPQEMLEIAMRNLNLQKKQLLSEEEKNNFSAATILNTQESFQNPLGNLQNRNINCDSRRLSNVARFLYGENIPPQDAEISSRNPLKQLNKSKPSCPFGRVPVNLINSPGGTMETDGPSGQSFTKRQTPGSEYQDLIVPKPEPNEGDSYELKNIKTLENIYSMDFQLSGEKSSELTPDSTITLRNKTGSCLPTKKEENKVHYQEPKVPENNQILRQSNFSSSNRKSESLNQNPIASSNQWQIPEANRNALPEKRSSFEQPGLTISKQSSPIIAPKRVDNKLVCNTPSSSSTLNDYMACFRTPVVKNDFPPGHQFSTPYNQPSYLKQQQQTPVTPFQTLQISGSFSSNEYISVKGRIYSILKQIGSGGSSKVFQVLSEKKQIYAIKYVNLEEADFQTIESYRNEIAFLSKLQQHSDKIIRLYDYEITGHHIYMVMECGNIDLNSWLKKKKTINPWERKSYWKNMLEAVHTIHQHGIVHSDLKPANFLIVDGMLKLIDFGIANQIQPDMTSIVKDSQVGTVNYMPPEAIRDMSSSRENGKSKSKISPKSDVWSLGCILYCMTYGKTPFQHIINQITKLHAIIDPDHEIKFPEIAEKDLQDVLRCCLIRDPKQRISVPELLVHPYVQIQTQSQPGNQVVKGTTEEMKHVLGQLVGLNSPNSILKAARTLYEQYSSGESHGSSSFAKPYDQKWKKK
ncbi:dual specificity protein kinase TTK isoform X2 [Phascolarctos cinereus]|uniref:Dual specificity protein kinase TTK n=1 Tax=Phascolarctos cinereus TaxID=38626 RepID=A0A6P5JA22_PHACI|nr:dual specificity protein kinase TTK isoform X2 [Phascolarctos cinereus]